LDFGKLLDNSSKRKDEIEITRLFLEGVTGYIHFSCARRELVAESSKLDLACFIKKELRKQEQKANKTGI
jgi:hypothetical protein